MSSLPPPLPNPSHWIFYSFIATGIVLAIMVALASIFILRSRTRSAQPLTSIALSHQETKAAYDNVSVLGDPQTPAISAALDRFNDAIKRRDSNALGDCFDFDRMYDELTRLANLQSLPANEKPVIIIGLRAGLLQEALSGSSLLGWTSHKVKRVILSDQGQEAEVYDLQIRGIGPKRYPAKMRYWLRKSGSLWKIWDMELVGLGTRSSEEMAELLPSHAQGTNLLPIVHAWMNESHDVEAGFATGDYARCDEAMRVLDGLALPTHFVAERAILWGELHFRERRFNDVLKDCDAAERTGEDVPFTYELRAVACDKLGRYEEAFQNAMKWEDTMGGDSEMYFLKGTALTHLNRPAEAAVAFGKSLDEDPDAAGSLVGLSGALPPGNKAELVRRFNLSQSPAMVFAAAVPSLQQKRDLDGMRALLEAYKARPESANDPKLVYYTGEWMIVRKQYKEAEATLEPLLPLAGQPGNAQYAGEYYYAAYLAHDAVDLYEKSTNPPLAFSELARCAYRARDYKTLQKLVGEYLPRFPEDSWACFFDGKVHQGAGDFEIADAAFHSAMTLGNSDDLDTFRIGWVLERFASGRGISAYDDIEPRDKVFAQLAELFAGAKDNGNLSSLLAKRRADAPNDSSLPLWEADAMFLAGDFAETVEILVVNRNSIEADNANRARWLEIYVRSQARLRHFDEARNELSQSTAGKDWWLTAIVECAAGNAEQATQALDEVLQSDGNLLPEFYADPDIGPALATPAFASWRVAHPNPTTRTTTRPAVDPSGV